MSELGDFSIILGNERIFEEGVFNKVGAGLGAIL
jgi:hypothetical protein